MLQAEPDGLRQPGAAPPKVSARLAEAHQAASGDSAAQQATSHTVRCSPAGLASCWRVEFAAWLRSAERPLRKFEADGA